MSKPFRGIIIYGVIIAAVFALIYIMSTPRQTNDNYTFSEFQQDLKDNAVSEIAIRQNSEIPTGVVTVTFRDTSKKLLYVENVGTITELLNEKNITYTLHDVTRSSYFVSTILPMVIMFVIMIVFFLVVSGRSAGAGGNVMNFGKSKAKMMAQPDNKTTFRDVAGLKEERGELEEVVDFLKTPQKYTRVGARIPKGVLLVGPPGTGKTLLARAVSGEAGVPFFHISGSDFVEMFVGVGASRVRDLFALHHLYR